MLVSPNTYLLVLSKWLDLGSTASHDRQCFTIWPKGCKIVCGFSCSVMPNSLQSHGLQPTRLPYPWDFLVKDIGAVCHFLLQGICQIQRSNPGLLHCKQTLYRLSYWGRPYITSLYPLSFLFSRKSCLLGGHFFSEPPYAIYDVKILCIDRRGWLREQTLPSLLSSIKQSDIN